MNKDLKNVVILGSTGSIGTQALQVIEKHSDKYRVLGLAVKDEINMLVEQVEKFKPEVVVLGDKLSYQHAHEVLGNKVNVLAGIEGMCELAAMKEADIILVSVSGAVGIKPTISAIKAGKRVALANKETLVAAGDIVMDLARKKNTEIIPVDSEHSAIFQCLKGENEYLDRICLTASGGPFFNFTLEDLKKVTVDMALNHPNWNMGPKITIDSATLMNKGLEVIEAHHLFNVDYDKIDVLVQRESVIHSMVELVDGSFIAHLGAADMRIPIQYALTYPERFESPAAHLNFSALTGIQFASPDTNKFPALQLAFDAGREGGTMTAVMNAVNEEAVQGFLMGKLSFLEITSMVDKIMNKHKTINNPGLEEIFEADRWARSLSQELINKK